MDAPRPDMITWVELLGLDSLAAWLRDHPGLAGLAGLGVSLWVALIAMLITRRALLPGAAALAKRSQTVWDDVLFEKRTLQRVSWAVPWLVLFLFAPRVPALGEPTVDAVRRVCLAALVIVGMRSLQALLRTVEAIYSRYPAAANRPIKGYLQIVMILAAVFGTVVVISLIIDRSPWLLMSGLGAMTAVLLLVFRDTLLSLVAGIRLTTNDLIRVGDWIEMSEFGADGTVVEIALHSVTVQNGDRTLSIIPAHGFLEHSFRNWRGVSDSRARRIKRPVFIDVASVDFIDNQDIERFARIHLLSNYMARKREELVTRAVAEDEHIANQRRLTNIGTLRAYLVEYLRQQPLLRQDLPLNVRQLAPGAQGIPLEIYAYCSEVEWEAYERIQSDIFDHVLAIVPHFGLRVFQSPSGADVAKLAVRLSVDAQPAGATTREPD